MSLSIAESEYITLYQAMRESIWLGEMKKELYIHLLNDTKGIKNVAILISQKYLKRFPSLLCMKIMKHV